MGFLSSDPVAPQAPKPYEPLVGAAKILDEHRFQGATAGAEQAAELAKRAPSPLAEVDPLDVFTRQVRMRLSRTPGTVGRGISSLFGGY